MKRDVFRGQDFTQHFIGKCHGPTWGPWQAEAVGLPGCVFIASWDASLVMEAYRYDQHLGDS